MLAISRALTLDPELLLMDEPSEALAPVIAGTDIKERSSQRSGAYGLHRGFPTAPKG